MTIGKTDYRGTYWGIDTDGEVKSVSERYGNGSVVQSMMRPDGSMFTHTVMKGRPPQGEVVTVFGLVDITFIPVNSEGGEYEKQVKDKLEAKAEERRKAKE